MEHELLQASENQEMVIGETLKEISISLEAKGYNAINQITGYLISGDPGYISNYQDARCKMMQYERVKVLEVLLNNLLK